MTTKRPHETVDRQTRNHVLDRDGHQCRFCGKKGPEAGGAARLQVHHIDRDPDGVDVHDPANLTTLCRSCHSWQHQQTETAELPVDLTPADEAELLAQDKEILRVLAADGPMRPAEIREAMSGEVSVNSVRERLWKLMGLDNIVDEREQQIVDQDVDTGEWGLVGQIAESVRGNIPEDKQRLVLRYEDALVRQALDRGLDHNTIAEFLGFSRRTIFHKEKRAYGYDFPLEAFQSGRRGWTAGEDTDDVDDRDEDDGPAGEDEEPRTTTWTRQAEPESLDELLGGESADDGEDAPADPPETHLDRAIDALRAAKSAL